MNVSIFEPYRLFNQLHRDLDRLAGRPAASEEEVSPVANWAPAIDIREEDTQFVLHADLPGVDPSQIEVTLDNGVLTLRGRRDLADRDERSGYRRVERLSGEFFRRFALPDTADSNAVKARYAHGVLEVLIPKQAQVLPRRIEVEAA
ncbi:MAG: Hsp20/alpha crystallin family protein [Steroidobacteraceae bacterium]